MWICAALCAARIGVTNMKDTRLLCLTMLACTAMLSCALVLSAYFSH